MNKCRSCGRRLVAGWHRCAVTRSSAPVPRAARPPTGSLSGRGATAAIPTRSRFGAANPGVRRPVSARGPVPPHLRVEPATDADETSIVASRPSIVSGGDVLEAALGPPMLLLFCAVVVVTPQLLRISIALVALLLLAGWVLSRFGVSRAMLLLRPRRARAGATRWPTLAFRADSGARVDDVRLYGHDSGVMLGDEVRIRGPRVGGVLRATSVVNHTTGVVLRRRGLARVVVMLLVDAWLLVAVVSALAAR